MVYLTNEQAGTLDGYLRDVQSAAEAVQQGTTGSAAPILDYLASARALLATETARGDKLAAFNADTPAMTALRDDVRRWADGPVADVRAALGVAGSLRSRGDCMADLVAAAVIRLVYPDPLAPVPDGQVSVELPPVVVKD